MKRVLVTALAGMLAMSSVIGFTPLQVQGGAPPQDGSGGAQKGFSPEQEKALRELAPNLSRFDVDKNGVPSWLAGNLGPADRDPNAAALAAMRRLAPAFRATVDDSFEVRQAESDDEGQTHVRLRQRYRNLPVVGSELVVHLKGDKVVGVNGRFTPDIGVGSVPALKGDEALAIAHRSLVPAVRELSAPELVVFVTPDNIPHLSWRQKVTYVDGEGLQREWIFADARTGSLLGRHSLIHSAKFRKIYDGNQECLQFLSQLPGTFLFQEGVSGPTWTNADVHAKGAYNGTGKTYDFYKQVFSRDSWDGSGGNLVSSVHFEFGGSCTPNNAVWIGDVEQMAYGDGDGVTFGPLATSLDVTAHELTHGVTQDEVGLVYQDESGAINEAISDIMGESVDYFFNGSTDWKIGEDVYTPGASGDALRYMNDPSLDDPQYSDPDYVSRDYYPDRYTGSKDYGGVHFNSGIANLAFQLLSDGGTHPQGKTNVVVPAIGIEQARQIWYKAVKSYMYQTPDAFAMARKATVDAVNSLYQCKAIRPAILDAVKKSWDAVGVLDTSQNGWAMLAISGPVYDDTSPCIYTTNNYNLLLNRDFEKGGEVWVESRGAITDAAGQPSHSGGIYQGVWKAWLGGNGLTNTSYAYQQVTIPSVATDAKLNYWLHIDTAETTLVTAYDTLQVQLRNQSNNVLTTLATYSNLNKNVGYALKTVDLTPYAGQTVRVYFRAVENSTNQTSFVVDDLTLNVK